MNYNIIDPIVWNNFSNMEKDNTALNPQGFTTDLFSAENFDIILRASLKKSPNKSLLKNFEIKSSSQYIKKQRYHHPSVLSQSNFYINRSNSPQALMDDLKKPTILKLLQKDNVTRVFPVTQKLELIGKTINWIKPQCKFSSQASLDTKLEINQRLIAPDKIEKARKNFHYHEKPFPTIKKPFSNKKPIKILPVKQNIRKIVGSSSKKEIGTITESYPNIINEKFSATLSGWNYE